MDRLIEDMRKGNKKRIAEGLSHDDIGYKMCAICFATLNKITSFEVVDSIKSLKSVNAKLFAYSVSDFAYAALDLLGVEKYNGNRDVVLNLIDSKFEFLM